MKPKFLLGAQVADPAADPDGLSVKALLSSNSERTGVSCSIMVNFLFLQ